MLHDIRRGRWSDEDLNVLRSRSVYQWVGRGEVPCTTFIYGHAAWHLDLSSPTRNQTHNPAVEARGIAHVHWL